MVIAPQQNWALYESLTRSEHEKWLRELSPEDRFAIYKDLFNMIWNARDEKRDCERLDQWFWERKLAARMRQVEAYRKLDQFCRERAAANHPC
jgi:hypothetical protein